MNYQQQSQLKIRVADYIEAHHLLSPGMRVVVGVSGGADSTALLSLLRELSSELGITLHVAHLNHLLRPDAEADAAFVQRLAHRWQLPVTIGYASVRALAERNRMGIEEAARKARYSFFNHVARSVGAERIAVAHQADDQAETMLFHLIRGSGASGLIGMDPRKGRVIRPLLVVTKLELEAYCRQLRISWRIDATNQNTDYYRNKIRNMLLPLLRDEFNPQIVEALLRLGVIIKDEEDFFSAFIDKILQGATRQRQEHLVSLDLPGVLQLPVALQRRVLRAAVVVAGGDLRDLGYHQVDDTLAFLASGATGGEFHLPHGSRVQKSYDSFIITTGEKKTLPALCSAEKLEIPGITEVAALGLTVRAEIREWRSTDQPRDFWKQGEMQAIFDYERVALPLYLRTRHPGDRIRLFGMNGSQKIKKLLVDLKIPRDQRDQVPLVVSGQEIYWVPGCRRSSLAAVTPFSKQILMLTVRKKIESL